MKQLVRKSQGFTLIEVMIVVAIVGILAAIAMAQFAAYRMRAFNASAESDVRNAKTAQELLMTDAQIYGSTGEGKLPGAGHAQNGEGKTLLGVKIPATNEVSGALLQGTDADKKPKAVGLGVGNGVYLRVDTMQELDISFNIYGRHFQGNRAYAGEAESTAVFICENGQWIGKMGIQAPTRPVTSEGTDFLNKPCGGDVTPNWFIL